jgi:hypothetical protein
VLALAGCGGTDDDPLSGTWSNTACFGSESTPADISRCTTALTFTTDLGVEFKAEWFSLPATAMYPRCTTTRQVTGQTWSTEAVASADTLTVTGSGRATIARANCVNMTDDLLATTTADIAIPTGDISYQINNRTLSIMSGTLTGTYTR